MTGQCLPKKGIDMPYEMSVTFNGAYVEARSVGDKSYQTAVALWREITTGLC